MTDEQSEPPLEKRVRELETRQRELEAKWRQYLDGYWITRIRKWINIFLFGTPWK